MQKNNDTRSANETFLHALWQRIAETKLQHKFGAPFQLANIYPFFRGKKPFEYFFNLQCNSCNKVCVFW